MARTGSINDAANNECDQQKPGIVGGEPSVSTVLSAGQLF
jgi:hypothetical protein